MMTTIEFATLVWLGSFLAGFLGSLAAFVLQRTRRAVGVACGGKRLL